LSFFIADNTLSADTLLWEASVSALAKLKLVASKRQRTINPVQVRRHKLVSRLHEQIELAKAKLEGRTYTPTRLRSYRNVDTGERRAMEVPKRVKEWYWTAENGKINLSIRYGSTIIELAKERNAIEVRNLEELLEALSAIKQATFNGELDDAILQASDKLRAGFIG
jgi:hypothetical protein